jgi:hypothetical protein
VRLDHIGKICCLKKSMKAVHHASLSKAGHDRALEMMDELLLLLSRLEPDIEGDDSTSDGEGMQVFNILIDIAVYFN